MVRNSTVINPILRGFELLWDFMHAIGLVILKFEENPIKNKDINVNRTFSP